MYKYKLTVGEVNESLAHANEEYRKIISNLIILPFFYDNINIDEK